MKDQTKIFHNEKKLITVYPVYVPGHKQMEKNSLIRLNL